MMDRGGLDIVMNESQFRTNFIKKLKKISPEIFVEFADPGRVNGIPDLIIFFKNKHARIETKKSKNASKRQHQEYYINLFNSYGVYSTFLSPENEEEVLNELRRYFEL